MSGTIRRSTVTSVQRRLNRAFVCLILLFCFSTFQSKIDSINGSLVGVSISGRDGFSSSPCLASAASREKFASRRETERSHAPDIIVRVLSSSSSYVGTARIIVPLIAIRPGAFDCRGAHPRRRRNVYVGNFTSLMKLHLRAEEARS